METLDWDAANLEHVARHGVGPDDVEEALQDPTLATLGRRRVGDEDRVAVIGATGTGMALVVVYIERRRRIRVVTARRASNQEVRQWHRRRK